MWSLPWSLPLSALLTVPFCVVKAETVSLSEKFEHSLRIVVGSSEELFCPLGHPAAGDLRSPTKLEAESEHLERFLRLTKPAMEETRQPRGGPTAARNDVEAIHLAPNFITIHTALSYIV